MPQTTQIQPANRYTKSDALAAKITELYAYITAANHRFLELVAEFDEKGYWQLCGVHSCAHWLNWQCGIGMNAAREKVRVARALKELPKISKAFARGEISYSKVRAITRAATAKTEDYLLMFARHGTAHHVEKLIAGFKRVNRLQAETAHENRYLKTRWDEDGCLVVTARIPAEKGALLLKAMELAVDRQFEAERNSEEENDTIAADVIASDYVAGGSAAGVDIADVDTAAHVYTKGTFTAATRPAQNPPAVYVPSGQTPRANTVPASQTSDEQKLTIAARRADAIAEMAESYLTNEAPKGSSADRYQVVVDVSADKALAEQASTIADRDLPRLDNGPGITAETSRRISCDCSIVPMFKGIKGDPLSVGRKTRAIPPAIMRALTTRDGGCRFPGCTHTRFADGHHIKHWADGGETSLSNLVLLCRHHHRLVHEGGFGCEVNNAGDVVFKSPRGNFIPKAFDMATTARATRPVAWLADQLDCGHVDSRTCVTKWQGERCDWDLAVGHLFVESNDGRESTERRVQPHV